MVRITTLIILLIAATGLSAATVSVGVEQLFSSEYVSLLKNKRIGLVTNHTAIDHQLTPTVTLLKEGATRYNYKLVALFSPEHGIDGSFHSENQIADSRDKDGIPVYSLYNKTRRPTAEMLSGIDLILYDIQDIGSRSYTYIATLFYMMEEAAKIGLPVVVLDRPNPINGRVIDGPMLDNDLRSIVGYIDVPYVHGMTVGELALLFNAEYRIGCRLTVIPMKGWQRHMTFHDTGLPWIPTSPHIPDADTPLYYPATGILGEITMTNIGVGYTLPFKCIGAPWIDAEQLAEALNQQKLPGVSFKPFYFRPFYGNWSGQDCKGVLIVIRDPLQYKPVSTQYLIIGILKSLYPNQFRESLQKSTHRKEMFAKINGTKRVWQIMEESGPIAWKLIDLDKARRETFQTRRTRYLIPAYGT